MRDLTSKERQVVGRLSEAWHEYKRLPVIHEADNEDVLHAIHAAQNIILARPGTEVAMGLDKEKKGGRRAGA